MKASQWTGLGILVVALPAFGLVVWFVVFHFFVMAPHSRDPDYKSAYWVERELYYGSDCARVMSELKADGVVEPGLIECTRDPHFGFLNTQNGTFLHLRKHFSLWIRWLPSGEKVIVDVNNGFVFWAKDGKVTNFVKLNPKLEGQLLESPPESAGGVRSPPSGSSQPSDAEESTYSAEERQDGTPMAKGR